MHPAADAIIFILQFIYYTIEGIILAVIPASFRRKNIAGQRVLVTGAGES